MKKTLLMAALAAAVVGVAFVVGGHKAYNYVYGGHPAPTGRALPNLINAVKMLQSKSKSKSVRFLILTF